MLLILYNYALVMLHHEYNRATVHTCCVLVLLPLIAFNKYLVPSVHSGVMFYSKESDSFLTLQHNIQALYKMSMSMSLETTYTVHTCSRHLHTISDLTLLRENPCIMYVSMMLNCTECYYV